MKLHFTICLVFTFFFIPRISAQDSSLLAGDSLENYINQALVEWQIPGAAVYIVKDGKVLMQKGFGVSNWKTKTKVDEQTVFPIASVSKTFTGTLFATLEAETKISLNDLVTKWLPGFTMKDKLYEQQLTLADILSHRSGWKTFQGDFINTETSLDYPSMIQKFSMMTPAYPLRSKFGYSNFGFMMAGECVKTITNQDYNTYLHDRFLVPLQMKRTYVFEDDIKKETNIVVGHTIINDTITVLQPDKIEPYSHGGIYSSIQDLGTWVNVLLNNGNFQGKNIIPESAINKMWTSHTIIAKARAADREFYLKTYGLGWEIMQYQNMEVMQHGGAYSGALTSVALVPQINLGIIVLTNQDDHLLQETLKWQIIDAFIQKKAINYTMSTIEFRRKRKAETPVKTTENKPEIENFAINMDAIIGAYDCEYYGKAYIKKENNQYKLVLEHHPKISGILTPYNKEQLTCTYNHPMFGKVQFPFIIEDNKIKSFTLFVDDFIESDGYEFIKI